MAPDLQESVTQEGQQVNAEEITIFGKSEYAADWEASSYFRLKVRLKPCRPTPDPLPGRKPSALQTSCGHQLRDNETDFDGFLAVFMT